MRREALLVLTLLAPCCAFPISRIGNSSLLGDRVEKYSVALPSEFSSVSEVHGSGVTLSSGLFTSMPFVPVDIEVVRFRDQFPSLVKQGRLKIVRYFQNVNGTTYRQLALSNRVIGLIGESTNEVVGISVCPDGRGYVAFAPKLKITQDAITNLLTDTVFEIPCQK